MRALSIFAFAAALFGAFIALVTKAVLDGHDTATMNAQLWVGFLGLLPVGVTCYFAFRDRERAARVCLVFSLVWWAGWGVLNDAAVHGWGSGMRFLP